MKIYEVGLPVVGGRESARVGPYSPCSASSSCITFCLSLPLPDEIFVANSLICALLPTTLTSRPRCKRRNAAVLLHGPDAAYLQMFGQCRTLSCIDLLVDTLICLITHFIQWAGGAPRVVVSTADFHARVWGSVPGLGGLKETKMFLPHPRVKLSIVGSLRDREVACSASDHQGSNFESCVGKTVSSHSSHHPQEVLLAQFSRSVHKGGLKPESFFYSMSSDHRASQL